MCQYQSLCCVVSFGPSQLLLFKYGWVWRLRARTNNWPRNNVSGRDIVATNSTSAHDGKLNNAQKQTNTKTMLTTRCPNFWVRANDTNTTLTNRCPNGYIYCSCYHKPIVQRLVWTGNTQVCCTLGASSLHYSVSQGAAHMRSHMLCAYALIILANCLCYFITFACLGWLK